MMNLSMNARKRAVALLIPTAEVFPVKMTYKKRKKSMRQTNKLNFS